MRLNEKALKFAKALLAGENKRQAAIKAGYPPATATQNANSLLKGKAMQEYLARTKKVRDVQEAAKDEDGKMERVDVLARQFDDAMEFLSAIMNDVGATRAERTNAAKALLPYQHGKQKSTVANPIATLGKKERIKKDANAAGDSVFGTADVAGRMLQ